MNNVLNVLMKNRHLTEYKFSQMFNDEYNIIIKETDFLKNTKYDNWNTRKEVFLKGYKEIPRCVICGEFCKFVPYHGFSATCCNICQRKYSSIVHRSFSEEKRKDIISRTKLSKSLKSAEEKQKTIDKRKQTCIQRYGGVAPAQNKDVMDKMKHTCLERHGVDNIFKDKEYIKQKTKDKYGVDNIFKDKEYIRKKFISKYGVTNPNYINYSKYTLDCLHSETNFRNMIKEHDLKSVSDIMEHLGVSSYCTLAYIHKYNIDNILNKNTSCYEDKIERWLLQYNIKVIRNKRLFDNKEIDIYLPDYKIGIEFNGSYWHSEIYRDSQYHQKKSLNAELNEIRLYHIYEYEWKDIDKIYNHLKNILKLNEYKIFARKCEIKEIDTKTKNDFLENNHLQGKDNSSIRIGLFYNNILVQVMTFCKPRFNKKYEYELSRLCTLKDYTVIGGASKMFKYFLVTYNPKSIISYSDYSKNTGNIYNILGFNECQLTKPNYIWINKNIILTRYQTQKHILLKQGYKGSSEVDIMHNRGFIRVYDCGNKVYEWRESE